MKNKKIFLALAFLFGISFGFSTTMAYNTDRSIIGNDFQLAEYKTVYTEQFQSPSNWMTCQDVDKAVTVTNQSAGNIAVRVKLEEQWLSNAGAELPLVSTVSNNRMAIINFVDDTNWSYNSADGYYYYNPDLEKDATTPSLISGVTLNCDANLDEDTSYASATYHLKITAQSVEAESRDAVWH
jgi:alternate signal-mediated exported protein